MGIMSHQMGALRYSPSTPVLPKSLDGDSDESGEPGSGLGGYAGSI